MSNLITLSLCALLLGAGHGLARGKEASLKVWHTFGVNSQDERIFERAVGEFSRNHPNIEVQAVRIPYLQNLPQFINSSQAGEAPDVIRLANSELGKIGHVSVEGFPLLEDLRSHLTPVQRRRFTRNALYAMRYQEFLYAVPASQSCMTLLFNKAIFDAAGAAYPTNAWTTLDFLQAARRLTTPNAAGVALPVKWSYWFLPFMAGFGGTLFNAEDIPTLSSPGTAEAMEWYLDLDRNHRVTGAINSIEAMSTAFQTGKAAMVIDGAWNWRKYVESGVDLGQALLPTEASTGKRLAPMLSYFGWAVSKQSLDKPAAVDLALWLSSREVQRRFALETYTLPTDVQLLADPAVAAHPVLSGFVAQMETGVPVPANRAASMLFEQLDTAIALTHEGALSAQSALQSADRELARRLSY